jgi:YfiH family protein
MRFRMRSTDGWSYYHAHDLTARGITHGFFTADTPQVPLAATEEETFRRAFSVRDAVVMYQEHGDRVHVIADGERPGTGDALIVLERGVAALVKTADCLPVIIADPEYPMAAVIHAGWRGTAQRITEKVLQRMVELGGRPERMTALFGPAIGPCCYRVGDDVRQAFSDARFPDDVFLFRDGARNNRDLFLNLKDANRFLLEAAGVPDVDDVTLCTYCTGNLFYSYRRGDRNVRQLNFVSLARRAALEL